MTLDSHLVSLSLSFHIYEMVIRPVLTSLVAMNTNQINPTKLNIVCMPMTQVNVAKISDPYIANTITLHQLASFAQETVF